jgi:hypothetical protein
LSVLVLCAGGWELPLSIGATAGAAVTLDTSIGRFLCWSDRDRLASRLDEVNR